MLSSLTLMIVEFAACEDMLRDGIFSAIGAKISLTGHQHGGTSFSTSSWELLHCYSYCRVFFVLS